MKNRRRGFIQSVGAIALVLGLSETLLGPAVADEQLLKRGEYLARAGDCVSCHTAPGGKPFAGGLYMPTPFGEISTPNITPDKTTGIGDWSDDNFYRAMHEGIGRHGEYLYPVFPFPWFTNVSRDDVLAIKAYLFSLAPVNAPRAPLKLAFPFSIRESLFAWRTAFFKARNSSSSDAASDRGAYLVEGLGHCGECHNRHKLFGASNWSGKLEGGEIEGWYAPNLTAAGSDSIVSWTDDQLVTFLKTGAAPGKGVALGPMQETIDNSLKYLSDDDLKAIAVYIKTATAKYDKKNSSASAPAPTRDGAEVYLNACAFCHQPDGKGIPNAIPSLAGDPAVTAGGPQNVIRVVLGGLEASHGFGPMPAVGAGLSDGDIAAVTNYVRNAWGNTAPADAGAGMVGDLRTKTRTLLAFNLAGGCPAPTNAALAKAISSLQPKLGGTDAANMLSRIDTIVPDLKKTGASDDEIVNGLTAAYCPVVMADQSVPAAARATTLGNFSTLVYGQLRKNERVATPSGSQAH
jgi:mono/diheme cytochrome c family protein